MAIEAASPSTTVQALHRALMIRTERRGGVVVLNLEGPLRLGDAQVLVWAVDELWAEHPAAIVLDLAGLTVEDELGVLVLPTLVARADLHHVRVPGRAHLQRA